MKKSKNSEPEKAEAGIPSWVRTLVPGVLVLSLLLGFGGYLFNNKIKPALFGSEEYRFSADRIVISSAPEWIDPGTLIKDALRESGLNRQESVLDPDLPEKVTAAFLQQPWVKNVHEVRLVYPATIQVELEYRRPIALVEVPDGFLPIDSSGTLLPSYYFTTISPEKRNNYIRIGGIESRPLGGVGDKWGDPALEQASELADLLDDVFQKMSIRWIILEKEPKDEKDDSSDEYRFRLQTFAKNEIIWGRMNDPKLNNDTKKYRLVKIFTEHESLDDVESPIRLDDD